MSNNRPSVSQINTHTAGSSTNSCPSCSRNLRRYSEIATTTDKTFTDNAIPFGTDSVQYQVLAQQTDKVVQGPIVPVKLGSGNGPQSQQGAA